MKKIFFYCFFVLFSLQLSLESLFAADSASSSSKSSSGNNGWTLAAMEFSFTQAGNKKESASQAAKALPSLILERVSYGSIRRIPEKETLDRTLKDLQTERLSLFLQLSKEVKTRDALVLASTSQKKLEKSLKEEDKKISEIEEKIKENLETVDKKIQESSGKIKIEESREGGQKKSNGDETADSETPDSPQKEKRNFFNPFALPFFRRGEKNDIIEENVVIYKDDPASLFTPSQQAIEDGFSSWNFEKEVTAQKINGLLSGKITSYGEYCSVTVELRAYPGAKVFGAVTEIGMLGELIPLASRIAAALSPKISNALPVRIEFDVEPKQASDSLTVTVDGVVQQMLSRSRAGNDAENSILVNAGVHRVLLESPGYESLSVLYSFSDQSLFTVKAELVPDVEKEIHIRLKKYKDGIFYANALESSEVSPENPYGTLTVNGKPALAVFKAAPQKSASELLESQADSASKTENPDSAISDENQNQKNKKNKSGKIEPKDESNLAFIQIPQIEQNPAFDGIYLFANAKPYDRAADIDHRRRMMYLAYTGLICSLPWTFYNVGNFTAENNAYTDSDRRSSYSDVEKWQRQSYISLGVTAAFGVWTVIELVRYLRAADKVLPVKAKIDKKAPQILQEIELKNAEEAENKSGESKTEAGADSVEGGEEKQEELNSEPGK